MRPTPKGRKRRDVPTLSRHAWHCGRCSTQRGRLATDTARSCHVSRTRRHVNTDGKSRLRAFTPLQFQSNHAGRRLGSWSRSEHTVSRSIRLCRWQSCHSPPSTPGLRRRRKRTLCLSLRRPVLPTLLKNVNTVDFSNHSGAQQNVATPPTFV